VSDSVPVSGNWSKSSFRQKLDNIDSYLLNSTLFGQKLSNFWIMIIMPKICINPESLISRFSLEETQRDFFRFWDLKLSGSLEKDLLPFWIEAGLVRGHRWLFGKEFDQLLALGG
jgi:hypothetical protein